MYGSFNIRSIRKDEYLKHKSRNPKRPGGPNDRYDPPSCRGFLMSDDDWAK